MSTESMTTTGAAVPQAAADGVTNPKGIGLFRMVTTVITLIVGAGVFSLSGDAAAGGASGWAILTAWGISAIGVFCLVMTFFALSRVKPDLKGGIYTYAATGFGDFLGFNSAWGYWISALLCTVSLPFSFLHLICLKFQELRLLLWGLFLELFHLLLLCQEWYSLWIVDTVRKKRYSSISNGWCFLR